MYSRRAVCLAAAVHRQASASPADRRRTRQGLHPDPPANNAQKDLLGCIAPVMELTGPGRGTLSRIANEKLKALVLAALDRHEQVFLNIKSKTS